jgi:hypothetical protein
MMQRDSVHSTFQELCHELRSSPKNIFPKDGLSICAQFGLLNPNRVLSLLETFHIASACMSTAFVLSQYRGAIERIAKWGQNSTLYNELYAGKDYATLGISQLSTSLQHRPPSLTAEKVNKGWLLEGFSPWVTGAHHADFFILGAWEQETSELGQITRKMLFFVHRSLVTISETPTLTALTECDTAQVSIHTIVPPSALLHVFDDEPATNTGSLRSVAIALGIVQQSIDLIEIEAHARPVLNTCLEKLKKSRDDCLHTLSMACDRIQLRVRVNQLALHSAQQALVACKGKGFIEGARASTLCRQALFFLVWSCPQEVQYQHLQITNP